jgi:hypothetical protein
VVCEFPSSSIVPCSHAITPTLRSISRDDRSGIPPENFAPERFLPEAVPETAIDPEEYVFGFGRRICPGRYLAMNGLMLACAALLKVFDIEPVRDENGCEVLPELKHTLSLIRFVKSELGRGSGSTELMYVDHSFPEPFQVTIRPRSEEAVKLVDELFKSL